MNSITLMSPGEMGSPIAERIIKSGIRVISPLSGRSKNTIERALILGDPSEKISGDELIISESKTEEFDEKAYLITSEFASLSLREAREIFERDYLKVQINRFGGNISKTAEFVEMERSALHRKLKSLGISSAQKFN